MNHSLVIFFVLRLHFSPRLKHLCHQQTYGELSIQGKSLIYMRNRSEPSIEPCGTSHDIDEGFDRWLFLHYSVVFGHLTMI